MSERQGKSNGERERGLEQGGRSNLATGRGHINSSWVRGHTMFGINLLGKKSM